MRDRRHQSSGWLLVLFAAAVLVLAGCSGGAGETVNASGDSGGQGEWPTAAELAGHECELNLTGPDLLASFLSRYEWVPVGADSTLVPPTASLEEPQFTGPDLEPQLVITDVGDADVSWPADTATVSGSERQLRGGQAEIDRGAELRLGGLRTRAGGPNQLRVDVILSLRPDGSVITVGLCRYADLEQWADQVVAAGGAESHAEAVSLVTDADSPADAFAELAKYAVAVTATAPSGWLDKPADDRYWHDAPDDLRLETKEYRLSVAIPDRWIGTDLLLCTRTTMAWASCVDLSADYFGDGVEEFFVVSHGSEAVQAWLVDSDTYDGLAKVADVERQEFDRYIPPQLTLRLTGSDSGEASASSTLSDVREGRVANSVGRATIKDEASSPTTMPE